jgi:hypothetical protein
MPLIDGYGVLIGTLHSYSCDARRFDFHYYHCNLRIRTRKGIYRCAIDLDGKKEKDGVQWRVVELGLSGLKGITGLGDGWHDLDSSDRSGALDYYRSPELQPTLQCVQAGPMPEKSGSHPAGEDCVPWKYGRGTDAFRELEPLLKQGRKLYVFGEPFRRGKGVHNIHQNQGDPPSSRWAPENGPWQDGALAVERLDGTIAAFLCRFKTQAFAVLQPADKDQVG